MVLVSNRDLFPFNLLQPIKIPYMSDNDNMDVGDSDPQPTCLSPRKTLPGTAMKCYEHFFCTLNGAIPHLLRQ